MKAHIVARAQSKGNVESIRAVTQDGLVFDIAREGGRTRSVAVALVPEGRQAMLRSAIKGASASVVFQASRHAWTLQGWDKALVPQPKNVVVSQIVVNDHD